MPVIPNIFWSLISCTLLDTDECNELSFLPLSLQVQQMKAQNKEEKQAKQQEREKLQREIAAREKAEKQKDEYEQRMREMKAEMEAKQVSRFGPSREG